MTGAQMLTALRGLAAEAWNCVPRVGKPPASDSMADDRNYLVGYYQGLRDAYIFLGGSWRDLSDVLDEEEHHADRG